MELKEAERLYLNKTVRHKVHGYVFKIWFIMELGDGRLQFLFQMPDGSHNIPLWNPQTVLDNELISEWEVVDLP